MTEKQIRRGGFTSVSDLEANINAFMEKHNTDSKPLIWAKTTEEILEKVN